MGHNQPGSPSDVDGDVDAELMAHLQHLKRPCTATSSSHIYNHSECIKLKGVGWLRFMAPEIEKARTIFKDRPMLISTISGMGGPAAALQAPDTYIAQHA